MQVVQVLWTKWRQHHTCFPQSVHRVGTLIQALTYLCVYTFYCEYTFNIDNEELKAVFSHIQQNRICDETHSAKDAPECPHNRRSKCRVCDGTQEKSIVEKGAHNERRP